MLCETRSGCLERGLFYSETGRGECLQAVQKAMGPVVLGMAS